MPKPIKRRERIPPNAAARLERPESGKRHGAMRKGTHTVPMPNPHGADLDWSLVKRILKQADIDQDEWERLK